MSLNGPVRRCLAVTLAATLTIAFVPAVSLAAEGLGGLNGRIVSADYRTPVEGAVVKAAHLASETVYESARTSRNGKFHIADLPAGSYELAVATDEGLYPTGTVLSVEANRTGTLALALAPAPSDTEEDEDDDKGGFWDKPLVATGTVIGVGLVLAIAADSLLGDSDDPEEIIGTPSIPD
jgi:hypothetical protein